MAQFFKFQNFPFTSLNECWICPSFVAKSLELCEQHGFGRGFFHRKIDFLFCLNSFVQRCRLLILFWENLPKLLNGVEIHFGALYALDLINSKLQKWFLWIIAQSKYGIFEGYFQLYQIKYKKLSLFSLNLTQISL